MKLIAHDLAYSSIVGGGLSLFDDQGHPRFIVNFMGLSKGITREETTALAEQFAKFIEEHGLEVPDRAESES